MSFSNADLLPRRLSAAGCRIASAQLLAHVALLAERKTALGASVTEAVKGVTSATEAIPTGSDEVRMFDVDVAADSCIAGFHGAIEAHTRIFNPAILPLTAAEQTRLQDANALLKSLFPDGTAFIRKRYRFQYNEMNNLLTRTREPANKKLLAALDLELAAGRFERWVGLYGDRLGITKARGDSDSDAKAVQTWHDAWGDLIVAVRSHFTDSKNAKQVDARDLLLSPYEQQAEAERVDRPKTTPPTTGATPGSATPPTTGQK